MHAPDALDVSTWDGLEVYVSGDGGKTYHLVYKKTGKQLTTAPVTTIPFIASPSQHRNGETKQLIFLLMYLRDKK